MKTAVSIGLASLLLLGACSTMGRPYIDDRKACDDIIDTRQRLDCYERAEQAERDWRKEKRSDQNND